jgi:hypothetical protein
MMLREPKAARLDRICFDYKAVRAAKTRRAYRKQISTSNGRGSSSPGAAVAAGSRMDTADGADAGDGAA